MNVNWFKNPNNIEYISVDDFIASFKKDIRINNLKNQIESDTLQGMTKNYILDLMEIEFLIEQKFSGMESIIKTNLGIKARMLQHLFILSHYTIAIEIFGMGFKKGMMAFLLIYSEKV